MGNTTIPCPKEYVVYHSPHNPALGNHGGALIYIRHDTPHSSFYVQSPLQAVAVQIHLQRKYTVVSLYLPPNEPLNEENIRSLIRQLPQPFLILGDFNGRHHLWGDIVANHRGNVLSRIIENESVGLLNTGEPTHFHIQTGSLTAIDLSVCSEDALLDFDWRVIDGRYTSDHFPIILNNTQSPPFPRLPKWNTNKADWIKYREQSSITAEADEFPSVDEALELLNATLFSAGLQTIPRTSGIYRRCPLPWWNDECRIAHRTMRASYTRYRRHNCDYYRVEYRKARSTFRLTVKKARKNSWSIFISSINSKTPLSLVWKKIRKIAGKYIPSQPPVLKINGTNIADTKVVADTFADHFANISRKADDKPHADFRRREEQRPIDFTPSREEAYNLPFTRQEFDAALSNCTDSAPGPDDIPYVMVKHAPDNTKIFILSIINRIYREHVFPTVWELAKVLPFVKPGKDGSLPGSYRPIALTSCLCKLMEKMVNTRLVWYLERKNFLTPAQCGFRRMHSTVDALVRMESSICEAFASRKHHITVFFDLEKAYDTTWRYGVLKELYECELRGNLPLFIKVFLTRRTFQVQVGMTLSKIMIQEGVPQGSVLSVTLFALAINGISRVIPPGVMYTLFVDDLSLSFKAASMAVAERRLQLSINKLVEWAEMRGFRFSTTKTVVMHFCRIRGLHPDPDLFINGHRIPCVEETRFLGLVFDNRLTWVSHLKQTKAKCLRALDILKTLSHTSWGADRKQLLRIYKALVFSKLIYGCEVYTSATPSRLKSLDSIHHAGIRIATGAFKSSPIVSMLVDAGELPLELHYQTLLVRSWYRFRRLPNSLASVTVGNESFYHYFDMHPTTPHPFGFRVKVMMENLHIPNNEISSFKYSITPPWRLPVVECCDHFTIPKREVSEEQLKLLFLDHASQHSDAIAIFTDGSKSNAGVGFGVSSSSFEYSCRLPDSASVFTAELSGILKAVKATILSDDDNFIIYCDSKSVLNSLKIFYPVHPVVLEILKWLLLANRRGRIVRFCWVPAHVGVIGNERADSLAKLAISQVEPRASPLPFRDVIPVIRDKIRSAWQNTWENLRDSNKKMREITSSTIPWAYACMPRRWETALCRLRIGHTRLTHSFLMENDHQPYCEDCVVPLTVRHLLVECPSLGDEREQFLQYGKGNDGAFLMSDILGRDGVFDCSGLFGFLISVDVLGDL